MPYYVLIRVPTGELYSMNLLLSDDEARRYGSEGETVPVQAIFVWTSMGTLEDFRRFLSVEQGTAHSPFSGLIKDMRADRVDVLELSTDHVRDRLRKYRRMKFVCLNPGPTQRVRRIDEFLAELEE